MIEQQEQPPSTAPIRVYTFLCFHNNPYNDDILSVYKPWRPKVLQFQIITNVLVTSFRFI